MELGMTPFVPFGLAMEYKGPWSESTLVRN